MGKPYALELGHMGKTFEFAMKLDVGPLAHAIAVSSAVPLLAVGSGGSFTAAHIGATLHQKYARTVAKPVTPLELCSTLPQTQDYAVLFVSAGGRNQDVLGAFRLVAAHEPRRLMVLCARKNSPLARMAKEFRYVDLYDYDIPSRKDGFLATNSLLSFAITLLRGYGQAFGEAQSFPSTLAGLVGGGLEMEEFRERLERTCIPLWQRDSLIVLYGSSGQTAALDLESKFAEAALGPVQISDYRNFAHGRHHWLAKRGDTTGVLAIITDDDRSLADKTLSYLPRTVPVARIDVRRNGIAAMLATLVSTFYVVGLAGDARKIDPGRPGVPLFGRRIYHLRGWKSRDRSNVLTPEQDRAIKRKVKGDPETVLSAEEMVFWKGAYERFVTGLETASFEAIVLDYDGTVCEDRHHGLEKEMAHELVRLLKGNIMIGIATGRGISVRKDLRRALDRELWSRVLVGYYNGADIGLLSENSHPDSSDETCKELDLIYGELKRDKQISRLAKSTPRRFQITIEPHSAASSSQVWDLVQDVVHSTNVSGLTLVRSSHSIDILAPTVGKCQVVQRIKQVVGHENLVSVLCIGDRGKWPGNDFSLLRQPHALSVNEVSPDAEVCWNLAPHSHRGSQATLDYLAAIRVQSGKFQIHVKEIGRKC